MYACVWIGVEAGSVDYPNQESVTVCHLLVINLFTHPFIHPGYQACNGELERDRSCTLTQHKHSTSIIQLLTVVKLL